MSAQSRELASLHADTPRERRTYTACLCAALLFHAGAVLWLGSTPVPAPLAALRATEIELAPPPPPPPPAAAEPPPPAPRPAPAVRPKPAPHPKQPPAPTPAPALLTAADTPSSGSAPVRFASDPNGRSYSSGLVAAAAPRTEPAAPPAPRGDGITPAERLERQPLWRGDDCRGYFPEHAQVDAGQVELIAVVRADGQIARLDVVSETPTGHGFARAARACVQNQRFSPALDRAGEPTTARARFSLQFSR